MAQHLNSALPSQPSPQETPEVKRYPQQLGRLIFYNQEPFIIFIRGQDRIVYVTDNMPSSTSSSWALPRLSMNILVLFVPVVGGGNNIASDVKFTNDYEISEFLAQQEQQTINPPQIRNRAVQMTRQLDPPIDSLRDRLSRFSVSRSDPPSTDHWAKPPPSYDQVMQQPPSQQLNAPRTYLNPQSNAPQMVQTPQSNSPLMYQDTHRNVPQMVQSPQNHASLTAHNPPSCTPESLPVAELPITERSVQEIDANVDFLSEKDLHQLLNFWYEFPAAFNKETYPYPCEGFIVKTNDESEILIFTRRLGCIRRPDDPARKGNPYAYFMVCGPNSYRAWEYVDKQPPAFKSTKYVNAQNIEMKGYALMAPGRRDDSESTWYAWNDQAGFVRCQSSCARILKKKYANWEPIGQIVMFDATSLDNGRNWLVKTISYIDHRTASAQNIWPAQAYFIEGLVVLPMSEQQHPSKEIVFYCDLIRDKVYAQLPHVLGVNYSNPEMAPKYSAVIFATWGRDGLGRRYEALIAAPEKTWQEDANLFEVGKSLHTVHWWNRPNAAIEQ